MGQQAPRREPGDAWPSRLADSACLCEKASVAPCQLKRVWAFRGTSFPRGNARTNSWTACSTQPRSKPRWGLGLPVSAPTPPNSRRAGRCANSSGATGVGFGLARPVDGPPETALSCEAFVPRRRKHLGGADQNLPHACGGVSVPYAQVISSCGSRVVAGRDVTEREDDSCL